MAYNETCSSIEYKGMPKLTSEFSMKLGMKQIGTTLVMAKMENLLV